MDDTDTDYIAMEPHEINTVSSLYDALLEYSKLLITIEADKIKEFKTSLISYKAKRKKRMMDAGMLEEDTVLRFATSKHPDNKDWIVVTVELAQRGSIRIYGINTAGDSL